MDASSASGTSYCQNYFVQDHKLMIDYIKVKTNSVYIKYYWKTFLKHSEGFFQVEFSVCVFLEDIILFLMWILSFLDLVFSILLFQVVSFLSFSFRLILLSKLFFYISVCFLHTYSLSLSHSLSHSLIFLFLS